MSFEGIGNTVHLLAAVAWIGGLAFLGLILRPLANRYLEAEVAEKLLRAVHHVVIRLGLAGALMLGGSGVVKMTQDPHFAGWFIYEGAWPKFMLAKHVLYLGMIVLAVLIWRTKKETTRKDLLDISLWVGALILLLTGFLTAIE